MQVQFKHMEIEFAGRLYKVNGWDGERATSILVFTKRGWRTLGGHGRANRAKEWAAVIAHLKARSREEPVTNPEFLKLFF